MSSTVTSAAPAGLETVGRDTPAPEVMALIARDGAVIIENLVEPSIIDALEADVVPLLDALAPGSRDDNEWMVDFYGHHTRRLTNLVTTSPAFRGHVLEHPDVLRLVDAMLLPHADSYWMMTAQVAEILPGQTVQALHRDIEAYPYFRSEGPAGPEIVCNCIVALTACTAANGATRVIPGSHRWPDFAEHGTHAQSVAAEMAPGSAMFISGKTVHGGGANTTADERRRALLLAYNAGWLVPEEAHPFLVPMALARTLSPRARQLLGFRSFHNESQQGATLWGVNYQELEAFLKLDSPA